MKHILTRQTLKRKVDVHRKQGRAIVFTNGCFDVLHAGHVRYLAEAKKRGDILVLGLNSDRSVRLLKGRGRPIVPEGERALVMASLKSVDYVTIFDEETPLALIELLQPDIIVKGGDWAGKDVVGGASVKQWGGRVVIIPYVPGLSTTNIIKKILSTRKKGG
ncbi:MAG: D-glycero-beta-D-manno-heptose 1-phosphate adenylyltransferase [Deltaproteobacteria bacterium]|nr:D-glycero-beta-D-manno-heptose 1-phosphate adenylyltransferase [Deltaproteobacteria bacterium]